MKKIIAYTLATAIACPVAAWAEDAPTIEELQNISLQNLGNIVTSVSRKPEDSFRAAAAIYVITNDDIKASGATHIAEVLRGVPGLDVSRFDSSNWAISSRGFNGFFSDKLLVQVDGRTIYTPLFAGVYWDIQNIPLEDIERIEIIRGPGATQWGANAVNGIINVITKNAAATQGSYASQVVGTSDRSLTDYRYGGKIDDNIYYRTYGEFNDRSQTPTPGDGPSGQNQWYDGKAGFRSDWDVSSSRKITLQGDAYNADIDLSLSEPTVANASGVNNFLDQIHSHGMNVLGRWDEKHSDAMQSTFQAYFDYQGPSYSQLQQDIYTYDFDYQTTWKANNRNDFIWGGGARYISANLTGSDTIMINKPDITENILNVFVQDQYAVVPKSVYFTFGSKLEHNDFTGMEVEPSARLAWYPNDMQTVWGAISRAVRTPSISERSDLAFNVLAEPPFLLQQLGSDNTESEELIAYEVGYRVKPVQSLTIDSTAYINDYQKLSTLEPEVENGIYFPYNLSNQGKGQSYGFETSTTWDVSSIWKLKANYTYINMVLDNHFTQDPTFIGKEGDVPHHQFMLQSQLFLPHDVRLVNTGYYVGRLPNQDVDAYFRFDTQVMWKATEGIELDLVGQNLLEPRHEEFGAAPDGTQNEIPRAVYARLTLRF